MSAEPVGSTARDPKGVVQEGYDRIAPRYLQWTQNLFSERTLWVQRLIDRINASRAYTPTDEQERLRVLELGCGAGVPGTQMLADAGLRIVANDISSTQIELARAHVPASAVEAFIQADMMDLQFEAGSFDAVVSLFSLFHLPRDEQPELLRRAYFWLRGGGSLLIILSMEAAEASYEDDWLGAPMFWSSFGRDANEAMLREAGFEILAQEVILEKKDAASSNGIPFLCAIVRKPD